jgi:hypothetical protein
MRKRFLGYPTVSNPWSATQKWKLLQVRCCFKCVFGQIPPVTPVRWTMTKSKENDTWHMKLGITRWKEEPLNPNPFSPTDDIFYPENPNWNNSEKKSIPVHNARKFSAVLGTMPASSSITILPPGAPSYVMSKKTLGFAIVEKSTTWKELIQEYRTII